MNAYVETMRGKLAAATAKIEKLSKEKSEADATGEVHSMCSDDLKAAEESKAKVGKGLPTFLNQSFSQLYCEIVLCCSCSSTSLVRVVVY